MLNIQFVQLAQVSVVPHGTLKVRDSTYFVVPQGTSKARESEVRMACSPDDKTYLSTTEPSQCRYLVVLLTPELCPSPKRAPRTWSKAAQSLFGAEL